MEDKFALISTSPENNNEDENESLYPQIENKKTQHPEKRNDLQVYFYFLSEREGFFREFEALQFYPF